MTISYPRVDDIRSFYMFPLLDVSVDSVLGCFSSLSGPKGIGDVCQMSPAGSE